MMMTVGLIVIMIVIIIVAIVIYKIISEESVGQDKNFHTKNFGYFSTSIHNDFKEGWKESSENPDLSIPNCKIKTFKNELKTYAHVQTGKEYQYSTATSRNYKVSLETRSVLKFFRIYYIVFDSKEEHDSNKGLIEEKFKDKTGSVKHFSSKNKHIVFHVSAEDDNGKEINYKSGESWAIIARRAVNDVKLINK